MSTIKEASVHPVVSTSSGADSVVPSGYQSIQLGGEGVKSILAQYKPEKAIAEYIWNGFDAGATEVAVDYETQNELGALLSISVTDNGNGIRRSLLERKFRPFHESEKAEENKDSKHHSLTHGKNGVGRLTFFTFANQATWTTTYQEEDNFFEYDIEIKSDNLENYTGYDTPLRKSQATHASTRVTFEGIRELPESQLKVSVVSYLQQEFGWFLELFKSRGYSVKVDGHSLGYDAQISDRDKTSFVHESTGTVFEISYIRWKRSLQNEYSKFYLINSKDEEVWKDTTKLNKQGDGFYHSVYVRSSYFDNFLYDPKQIENKPTLSNKGKRPFNSRSDDEYKFLELEVTNFLRKKRKPFLVQAAGQLVDDYEKGGILPPLESEWEAPRRDELKGLVRGLYQIQPKIFSGASIENKKAFVRLLNALLDSDGREQLLEIIDSVVSLDNRERDDLLSLLRTTELSSIIHTMKLITDRYKVVDALKELVYNTDLKANERDHLQKMIDENYWIFGEQYHLLTSTEAKFEKALREYIHHLTGEVKDIEIDHPDKNREMDIFLCRQNKLTSSIENIVVELKSPSVYLGEKEVSQVKKYMNVVMGQDEFNGENTQWEFILVGNRFDTSHYIEDEIANASSHGEQNKGLIFKKDRCKIYVRKWSDVFTDFECRHKFLEERLKLKRDTLTRQYSDANEVVSVHTKA